MAYREQELGGRLEAGTGVCGLGKAMSIRGFPRTMAMEAGLRPAAFDIDGKVGLTTRPVRAISEEIMILDIFY